MLITVCRLVLHDYLYYASREMGRLYETEKYLHNYGLTYALGLARVRHNGEVLDDLGNLSVTQIA